MIIINIVKGVFTWYTKDVKTLSREEFNMKRILVLFLVLFTGIFIVGCENQDSETLTTVSMFGGTDPNAATYKALIAEFEAANGWKVEDNSASSSEEWKSSVIADFKSGNEPDVVQFFTGATADPIVSTGKVVSIADIRKEFPDYAKNISKVTLGTHSVPTTGFVEGMFVNTTFFTTPELQAYLLKDNWTWSEFLDICEKLVVANAAVDGFNPIAFSATEPHYWIEHILLGSLGKDFAANMPKSSAVTETHEWTKALLLLNQFEKYMSQEETPDAMKSNFHTTGKSALYVDGSWYAGNISKDATTGHIPNVDNVKVFPFPSVPKSLGGTDGHYLQAGFTTGFYISQKAWDNPAKRAMAVKFIETMTSTKALSEFAKIGGIPADSNVVVADQTNLQKQLNALTSKVDHVALPLSDLSKSGTFAKLVEYADSFVNGNGSTAVVGIKDYLDQQE